MSIFMTSERATTRETRRHYEDASTFLEALDFLAILVLVDGEHLDGLVDQLYLIHLY